MPRPICKFGSIPILSEHIKPFQQFTKHTYAYSNTNKEYLNQDLCHHKSVISTKSKHSTAQLLRNVFYLLANFDGKKVAILVS